MKLDKNYTLTNDNNNWILTYESDKKANPKTGKEFTSKDEWYYPNIGMALKKYTDESLKPCGTVVEMTLKIKELWGKIDSFHAEEVKQLGEKIID